MRSQGKHDAFSVIELVIVVLVVGVLASLVLTTLSYVRQSARTTQCLAHIRSCGQAATAYTTDYRGTFPLFADPQVEGDTAFFNAGMGLPY